MQTSGLVFIGALPLTSSVRINDRTFRFLLGFDKKNISYLQHKIGTFQLSRILIWKQIDRGPLLWIEVYIIPDKLSAACTESLLNCLWTMQTPAELPGQKVYLINFHCKTFQIIPSVWLVLYPLWFLVTLQQCGCDCPYLSLSVQYFKGLVGRDVDIIESRSWMWLLSIVWSWAVQIVWYKSSFCSGTFPVSSPRETVVFRLQI